MCLHSVPLLQPDCLRYYSKIQHHLPKVNYANDRSIQTILTPALFDNTSFIIIMAARVLRLSRLAYPKSQATSQFHLWQTQPHFGEVQCKSPAIKSWTFIGCHWLKLFNFFCCFLWVINTAHLYMGSLDNL